MDSNEFCSPGSRNHASFGLLDDKAMQDLSMENLHKVRDKPPIPFKQMNPKVLQARQLNNEKSICFDMNENPDQTQESVHLNDSDLRKLEYEYTIDVDDDDEEDKENLKSYKTKLNDLSDLHYKDISKSYGYSFAKNDFTNVSPDNFKDLDKSVRQVGQEDKTKIQRNNSTDLLIDESSNILRNSNEFDNTTTDQPNQSGRISYDKMDEINDKCQNRTQNTTLNFTLDQQSKNFQSTKSDFTFTDFEATPKVKHTYQSNERDSNLFHDLKEKPTSFNLTGIDDTVNCMNRLTIEPKKEDQTKVNDTTLNFSTNLSSINHSVQQSVEKVKRIGQSHLMNFPEDYLNLISKPGKDQRHSTSTVRPDPKNTSISFSQDVPLTPSRTFNQTIEPQVEPKLNENNFKKCDNNPFDQSVQVQNSNPNPFDNPFDSSMGNFGLANVNNTFSQFNGDFLEQINHDEQVNRKEFADNELTLMNQTGANSSDESLSTKWWKNPNPVQPNNLELSGIVDKKPVKVEEFFMVKSELPSYLAERESDVCLNETGKDEKTILKEKNTSKEPLTPQNADDITFSSNNQGSTTSLSSSNFSFTLNSSDTGEFIQPRNPGPKTPFQVTKALETLAKKKEDNKMKNLEKINQELDKVQNRLEQKHTLSEPLMSSSIKISQTNANLKSMIQMDETISSINSSDISTQKTSKSKVETKTGKESKSSKASSGSLTSTPSKMTKSASECSNLNSLTSSSLMEKFYKSDNQDSFISSIPERSDSTLMMSNRLKNKQNNLKKTKNSELKTTPDSTKMSQHDENRQSISNVSSSSSNSSDPSNTMNNQFNVINNLAAAMINNSTNSNNPGNGLVPVAFIPLNSFIPCVQKFYDDMQTTQGLINKTNMSSNLSTHSLNQAMNTKLFVDTMCTNSTSSLPSLNYGKFELPFIELDKNSIDFGHIAEGCYQTLRIHGKLQNSNLITKTHGSYFQIELSDSTDWTIQTYESEVDEKTKKLEDDKPNRVSIIKKKFNEFTLKSKFRKTLSIFPDKNFDHQSTSNQKVQFDLMSNFYEFFIQLNTKDLFFYKELISGLDSSSVDQLEPLEIKTFLYIYYYFNSSDNFNNPSVKRYLLNRIDVKFVLGYGRLRTNVTSSIDFEIPDEILETIKQESFNEEADKTLTSVDDMGPNRSCQVLEQVIPLSNAGNIDIEVDCYLSQNDQQITSIKFRDYEFKLDESLLFLQSKSRHKQFARIVANKLHASQLQGSVWEPRLDNIKLIIEFKPNGFRYEIPVCLKFVKKIVEVNKNLGKNLKLAASRSILFFGKSLNSCVKFSNGTGLNDELTIANMNTVRIKVQLVLSANSAQNCFKFSTEMAQTSTQLNDSMDQMVLVLEPSENFRLKLKFLPPQNFDSSIITGVLKMSIVGVQLKYNIQLVGFMSEGFLEFDHGLQELTAKDNDPLHSQITYRNVRNFNYSIEFMQTSNSSVKNIYRKIIKLKNKSQSSKLVVYPCVFNKKLGKEITQGNSKISKFNEICYDLGIDAKSYVNKLRVLVNKENQVSSNSSDLSWFEIKPDETYALNLEIIAQKIDSNKQEFCNLEDFNLCLFWIEYDINAYCTQFVQTSNPTTKQSTNFIDIFLNKLMMNNNFFSSQNNLPASMSINDSSAKLHRLSSISSSSLQDQSCLSNNSFMSKSKFSRNDFMRLMCQGVKCSVLNLVTQVFSGFDETMDKKEDFLQEKVNDLTESWSVSPSTIVIESVKLNETRKIYLKNNLSRKQLEFDVKYRTNYLSILPSNGILEPNGEIELIVKPRPEVFSQLPWFGVISIWCNKIQKDIRVSFYSQKSEPESQRSLEMSKMKNLTNSSINTLAPTLISTSTPYGNSIESGTIISDLSQYTIDSLSLTPLISASFINVPSSNSFSVNKTKSFSLNSTTDDSMTKIVREGNDANVRFPPVPVTQRKSVELTLTNPTNSYVKWKAYSTVPAFVRLKDTENKLIKSNYSVFLITPNSGSIAPNLNQKIKIEFCPREVYGQFNQYWEIDTRTDIEQLLQNPTNDGPMSYTCKLILTGTSIPIEKNLEQKLVQQDDETSSRLANRILKSKTNSFNESKKENDKYFSSTISQSLLSSLSNTSTSGTRDRVFIKDEVICFPDTEMNQTSKCFVTIHNRKQNVDCKISVYTLMEPFYCKHVELSISPNHYVKIPIEFRPKAVGDYNDKILIKCDLYDVPLTCVIKAKCIQ